MKELWKRLSKYERIILPLVFINAVILIIYLFFKPAKFQLENINVAEKSDVKITENITLNFNKNIPESFYDTCNFTIDPQVELSSEIERGSIILSPKPYLAHDTTYTLSINCKDLEESIRFQTSKYEDATTDEIATMQIEKDKAVADSFRELYEEQPWREKLPIETDEFIITYAQSLNTFLIENKTSIPNENLGDNVKLELETIEAPPEITITWRE